MNRSFKGYSSTILINITIDGLNDFSMPPGGQTRRYRAS
jgi:hypothetical protein